MAWNLYIVSSSLSMGKNHSMTISMIAYLTCKVKSFRCVALAMVVLVLQGSMSFPYGVSGRMAVLVRSIFFAAMALLVRSMLFVSYVPGRMAVLAWSILFAFAVSGRMPVLV